MAEEQQKIDPLYRVFVPREGRDVNGHWTFRTLDGDKYRRDESGAIRRVAPKVNGKLAKKRRRKLGA